MTSHFNIFAGIQKIQLQLLERLFRVEESGFSQRSSWCDVRRPFLNFIGHGNSSAESG